MVVWCRWARRETLFILTTPTRPTSPPTAYPRLPLITTHRPLPQIFEHPLPFQEQWPPRILSRAINRYMVILARLMQFRVPALVRERLETAYGYGDMRDATGPVGDGKRKRKRKGNGIGDGNATASGESGGSGESGESGESGGGDGTRKRKRKKRKKSGGRGRRTASIYEEDRDSEYGRAWSESWTTFVADWANYTGIDGLQPAPKQPIGTGGGGVRGLNGVRRRQGAYRSAAGAQSAIMLKKARIKSEQEAVSLYAAQRGQGQGQVEQLQQSDAVSWSETGAVLAAEDDPYDLQRSVERSKAAREAGTHSQDGGHTHAWASSRGKEQGQEQGQEQGSEGSDPPPTDSWLPWCREPAADELLPIDKMTDSGPLKS